MTDGVQITWNPWRNHNELLDVRSWLFPDQSSDKDKLRRKACDQTSAWKLRGNLPHAVESTWLLTEAVLTDKMPVDQMPIFAIKAAYITAISRFVTGLLDSQQDSKFKVSMYAKAQQIGLPAVFVDIRHEATHGDMPSLANLRSAAQRAMQWLWDDYWKRLPEGTTARQIVGLDADDLTTPEVLSLTALEESVIKSDVMEQAGIPDSNLMAGGWKKWQGRWDPKPIGMI